MMSPKEIPSKYQLGQEIETRRNSYDEWNYGGRINAIIFMNGKMPHYQIMSKYVCNETGDVRHIQEVFTSRNVRAIPTSEVGRELDQSITYQYLFRKGWEYRADDDEADGVLNVCFSMPHGWIKYRLRYDRNTKTLELKFYNDFGSKEWITLTYDGVKTRVGLESSLMQLYRVASLDTNPDL